MNKKENIHLVKAIVDVLIFFEFSDESAVDPDAATDAVEQMAAELQLMEGQSRSDFCSQLRYLSQGYPPDKAEFIAGLGEALGLA
jgi:hypothetical protein